MYWESLTQDQLRKIYAKFNATEESLKNDVQYLKQWLEKQPHLPDVSGTSVDIFYFPGKS